MLVSHDTGLWAVNGSDIRFLNLYNTDKWMVFGRYENQNRAIKVLDAIQTAYELSLYCDHAYDSSAQIQRPYIFVNNTVFQMPQDEEVEV